MFIYSVGQQLPLHYRLFPEKIKDVKAFSLCLQESAISNVTIIADKGFFSKKNIDELDKEKLQYIIPLSRDSSMIEYESLNLNDKKSFDGFFEFEKRFIWYKNFEIKEDNQKVVVFLDEELKTNEEKDYLL
ncbi:MAG: transposase [Bacteroidales bacterium]|nr:transposase [Bacteroidales bacterium]